MQHKLVFFFFPPTRAILPEAKSQEQVKIIAVYMTNKDGWQKNPAYIPNNGTNNTPGSEIYLKIHLSRSKREADSAIVMTTERNKHLDLTFNKLPEL